MGLAAAGREVNRTRPLVASTVPRAGSLVSAQRRNVLEPDRIVPLTLPATPLALLRRGRLRRLELVSVSSSGGGAALTVKVIVGLVPTLPASSSCDAPSV
jgi:hypothetical protein